MLRLITTTVGCALLSENEEIILGCNIESVAYPSNKCAERVAIYAAISRGITKFKATAIAFPIHATVDLVGK